MWRVGLGSMGLFLLLIVAGCRRSAWPLTGQSPSPLPSPVSVWKLLTVTPTSMPMPSPSATPVPSPTPLPPSPTPDLSLVPVAFTYRDGLLVLRHPAGWQVDDRSSDGEILLELRTPDGAVPAARALVNVFPLSAAIGLDELPALADTYVRNLLGDLHDWVLPPAYRWQQGTLVATIRTPVEDPQEQVHLELWFRLDQNALVVVLVQTAEAGWASLAPVAEALAHSVHLGGRIQATNSEPLAAVAPAEALVVEHVRFYTATTGSLYLLGEVVNTGSAPYEDVLLTVRLLASEGGEELAGVTWPLDAPVVEPGDRLPVLAVIGASPAWQAFRVAVVARQANAYAQRRHRALRAENVRGDVPDLGAYRLVGEVVNGGSEVAEGVFVLAGLYDASGQVVGVSRADIGRLEPGQRAPFEVRFPVLAGEVATERLFLYGTRP